MNSFDHLAQIAIVGSTCSGKTTLARALAKRLDVPHIELDAHRWGPNWTPIPFQQMRGTVDEATAAQRWVCDGNYSRVRDIVWGRATTVIWLNYSFPLVARRAVGRTLYRSLSQPVLYGENRESFFRSFFSRDSILLWVLQSFYPVRRRYRELFADPQNAHMQLLEFTTRLETKRFLHEVAAELNQPPESGVVVEIPREPQVSQA